MFITSKPELIIENIYYQKNQVQYYLPVNESKWVSHYSDFNCVLNNIYDPFGQNYEPGVPGLLTYAIHVDYNTTCRAQPYRCELQYRQALLVRENCDNENPTNGTCGFCQKAVEFQVTAGKPVELALFFQHTVYESYFYYDLIYLRNRTEIEIWCDIQQEEDYTDKCFENTTRIELNTTTPTTMVDLKEIDAIPNENQIKFSCEQTSLTANFYSGRPIVPFQFVSNVTGYCHYTFPGCDQYNFSSPMDKISELQFKRGNFYLW